MKPSMKTDSIIKVPDITAGKQTKTVSKNCV
jgi:hypothetical protein